MKLPRTTLIAVPMLLGVILSLIYLRTQPLEKSDRSGSVIPVRAPQPTAAVWGGTAASVDGITALRDQVESLRAELSSLRQQIHRQAQPASESSDNRAGADVRVDSLARAEAAREQETRMASVDAAFRQQAADPTWSASTSSAIRTALSSEEVGNIQANNIDCRADSCRVELRDDGSGSLAKSMPILAQQLAGALPSITASNISQANGDSTLVLYLSRQDEQQPRP